MKERVENLAGYLKVNRMAVSFHGVEFELDEPSDFRELFHKKNDLNLLDASFHENFEFLNFFLLIFQKKFMLDSYEFGRVERGRPGRPKGESSTIARKEEPNYVNLLTEYFLVLCVDNSLQEFSFDVFFE